MSKKIARHRTNVLQNMTSLMLLVVLINIALLPSAYALNAISSSPLQSISTTVVPQQPPPSEVPQPQPQPQQPPPSEVPQENQQVVSPTPPQFPQISWDELEEAEGFIANGKMDSTLYTINGNWKSTGDWSMNVADGELMNFTTTMGWYNGTAGHSHEFLNFEADEDGVDISAEDQTISVAGTMDVGTNGAVAWEDVPSEIVIERGRIIGVSVDNEATDEHFSGQSVYGNLTSLSICSTTPGPAMQVSPGC
jgi:hypothetical protein